jgi:hypothetical protein
MGVFDQKNLDGAQSLPAAMTPSLAQSFAQAPIASNKRPCFAFNDQQGCSYGTNCRHAHHCNLPGCPNPRTHNAAVCPLKGRVQGPTHAVKRRREPRERRQRQRQGQRRPRRIHPRGQAGAPGSNGAPGGRTGGEVSGSGLTTAGRAIPRASAAQAASGSRSSHPDGGGAVAALAARVRLHERSPPRMCGHDGRNRQRRGRGLQRRARDQPARAKPAQRHHRQSYRGEGGRRDRR